MNNISIKCLKSEKIQSGTCHGQFLINSLRPGQGITIGNQLRRVLLGDLGGVANTPRPNIKLEFKLRKENKSGEWKAFDMVAEGSSLLSSKQSEWNTKIRQEGILQVADELEKLAAQPIRFESNK